MQRWQSHTRIGSVWVAPHVMRCGAQDLGVYVSAYRRTGFASTLNWYRTSRENWDDEANVPMVVPHPALMVTAGRDRVLRPALSEGMEAYVPNLKRAVGRTVVRRSAPSQVSLTRHGAGGPVSFFLVRTNAPDDPGRRPLGQQRAASSAYGRARAVARQLA